jgi:hypothetical protein
MLRLPANLADCNSYCVAETKLLNLLPDWVIPRPICLTVLCRVPSEDHKNFMKYKALGQSLTRRDIYEELNNFLFNARIMGGLSC